MFVKTYQKAKGGFKQFIIKIKQWLNKRSQKYEISTNKTADKK